MTSFLVETSSALEFPRILRQYDSRQNEIPERQERTVPGSRLLSPQEKPVRLFKFAEFAALDKKPKWISAKEREQLHNQY